jgi:hypothetical protein
VTDLAVLLIGVGIGLLIVITVLWSQRATVQHAWRERRAELFGGDGQAEDTPPSPSLIQPAGRAGTFRLRQLAAAVCLLAVLGSALVAIQTSDETVRVVNIALCAILAVGGGMLLFGRR